jgi:PAS domain S-box-containing protein
LSSRETRDLSVNGKAKLVSSRQRRALEPRTRAPLLGSVSIRLKLFVLVAGLIAIVTGAQSWFAYRAMRASALTATSARLNGIATQWGRLLEAGAIRQLAGLRTAGDSPAIRNALLRPDATTAAAAAAVLRPLLPGETRAVAQLLNADRTDILSVGDSAVRANPAAIQGLLSAAAARHAGALGAMHDGGGDAVINSSAARIVIDGIVRGYIVLTIQLHVNPSPEEINRLFGGTSTRVRLANLDGSLWTDLAKPIAGPAITFAPSDTFLSYASPVSGPVFAALRPIAGSPWMVVLESAQSDVLAQTNRFLLQLTIAGVLALLLGSLGAIALSVSITRPIERLTNAANAVAGGDYSYKVGLPTLNGELGHLAGSFDSMVSRVQQSFAARQAAEEYYRHLVASVPLPLWVFDPEDCRILDVNDAASAHYGYSRAEFLSMTIEGLRPFGSAPSTRTTLEACHDRNNVDGWRHRTKDGSVIDVELHAYSMTFRGRAACIVIAHDVTERKRAALAIQHIEEKYSRLVREAPNGITFTSLEGRFLGANPAFVEMLGYGSEPELLALDTTAVFADPGERTALIEQIAQAGQVHRAEIQLTRKDGSLITVLFTARLVTDTASGETYLESVTQDVTNQRRVERHLQQAQKMDAVGQLAGGMAHDFNNLLTVIMSYGSLLLMDATLDEQNREFVESIQSAADSATALTRQLLIFSRQDVIQPKVMHLNALVTGTGKMLKRLIGEHVELATMLDPDAGAVMVDPGQLEQVIVNLAVNARDAMPNGGRLLIESKNVEFHESFSERNTLFPAGAYVTLAVSDEGVGMDAATQARIFEPFFTTKPPGKGTGLGLSTVYGIVQRSGGHILVYSELGKGTSVKMYFPRFDETTETPAQLAAHVAPPNGTETILLVEDEAAVRVLVRQVLERQGYVVLEVPDGESAIDVASKYHGPIHLLLTDVVMPRMSGRILAQNFATLRPDARILFVSGYTDDAILHHGVLEEGIQFLQKPFTPDSLANKVRLVLDSVSATDNTPT